MGNLFHRGVTGMSEAVAHVDAAHARRGSEPAYGDGRFTFQEPPKPKETLDPRAELALAVAIFGSALAAYAGAFYALYRAVSFLA